MWLSKNQFVKTLVHQKWLFPSGAGRVDGPCPGSVDVARRRPVAPVWRYCPSCWMPKSHMVLEDGGTGMGLKGKAGKGRC